MCLKVCENKFFDEEFSPEQSNLSAVKNKYLYAFLCLYSLPFIVLYVPMYNLTGN